jgi:hypothetical protein
MQKRLKMGAIAVLTVLLMTTLAYAVIKYTKTVQNTGTIKGYEISLWRLDTNAAVTSIPWGDLETNSSKNTETVFNFTEKLVVKNTGDFAIWVGWKVDPTTPLPSGVTLTAKHKNINGAWVEWNENTGFVGYVNDGDPNGTIVVGGTSYPVQWILTLSANASRGALTFNIELLAANTTSG